MTTAAKLPPAFDVTRLCTPPELRLEGELILWRWKKFSGSALGRVADPRGALNQFINIKTGNDLLAFARDFGPLGLCAHGRPLAHAEVSGGGRESSGPGFHNSEGALKSVRGGKGSHFVTAPVMERYYCAPKELYDGWLGEPVKWWLRLAGVMRAILRTVTRLKRAQRPLKKNLKTVEDVLVRGLDPNPLGLSLPRFEKARRKCGPSIAQLAWEDGPILPLVQDAQIDATRSKAWTLVLEQINRWLLACPVRLHFTFTDTRPAVDFSMSFIAGDERGCFPALVFELVGRIHGKHGQALVRCKHCSAPFPPRSETNKFCPACREAGWPQRYANRKAYKHNRQKILSARRRKRRALKTKGALDDGSQTTQRG